MASIFISYRREDSSGYAGRLYDRLHAHFGRKHRVFMDVDSIEPGEDFVEAIKRRVASCDVLIAVIGKQWLSSVDEQGRTRLQNPEDFVRVEIQTALDRNIRVIPALVDGARMPGSQDLPPQLSAFVRRNYIQIHGDSFTASADRLIESLERALAEAKKITPSRSRWKVWAATAAAVVLMGLVLFVTPYFYNQPPTPDATKIGQTTKTEPKSAEQGRAEPQSPPAPVPRPKTPGPIQSVELEDFTIDTDLYEVAFSNRGAVVQRWVLKNYKDSRGKPVDLVNTRALEKVPAPFSVTFKGQAPPGNFDKALFQVQRLDPLTAYFEYSDGRTDIVKYFKFLSNSYLVTIASEVSQNGAPVPHGLAWRGGFGDSTVVNPASTQSAVFYDLSNSKLVVKPAKDAKDGPVSSAGQFSLAGLQDRYFAGVFLPEGRSLVELTEFSDMVPNSDEARVGASVGGEGSNQFTFFAGPKDYDLLQKVNPKLDVMINNHLSTALWIGVAAFGFVIAGVLAARKADASTYPVRSVPKQRHWCLTAWLIFIAAVSVLDLLDYYFMFIQSAYNRSALTFIEDLAELVFVFALFKWKKWGFYGYAIVSILSVPGYVLSYPRPEMEYGSIPLQIADAASFISVMYWFLQIGKRKRAWVQLD